MTLLRKSSNAPARTSWSAMHPWSRFLGNDFLDLWDGDNVDTIPSINISEQKDHFEVEMAAPGMKKEDFNVDLNGNLLTISCEKEIETKDGKDDGKEEKSKYSRREYNYSSFSRSFTLPETADAGKIDASYQDGILRLNIPKKPDAQKDRNQRIEVK